MGWGARFAGVLVAGVVLSACGGAGPEGQSLPAATAKPSPTASPTSLASDAPNQPSPSPAPSDGALTPQPSKLAKEKSPDGLRAFALYYVDAYNHALRTGETDLLASLATDACEVCESYVTQIRSVYDAGGKIEGGTLEVLNSAAPKIVVGLAPIVDIKINIKRQKNRDSQGRVVKQFLPENGTLFFLYPEWQDSHWILNKLKIGVTE